LRPSTAKESAHRSLEDPADPVADQDDPGDFHELVHQQLILVIGQRRELGQEVEEPLHFNEKEKNHQDEDTELQGKAHNMGRPDRGLVIDKQSDFAGQVREHPGYIRGVEIYAEPGEYPLCLSHQCIILDKMMQFE